MPPAPRRLSLALRTALGVVVLLALVLAAFTAASLGLSGRTVDEQLGQRVDQIWERSLGFLRDREADLVLPEDSGDGLDRSPLDARGQPIGMVALVLTGDGVLEASMLDEDDHIVDLPEGDVQALTGEVSDLVANADWTTVPDEEPMDGPEGEGPQATPERRIVELESGRYMLRAEAVSAFVPYGPMTTAIAVVGLPTEEVDRTKATLAAVLIVGGLAALVVAGVGGWWWIRRSLRLLEEVSRAAARVAEVPMGSGTVELAPYRVRGELARPGDEVGDVGQALNRLIDSVDGAFGQRNVSEKRLRTFVADASHELRTPLAAVRGYTEMVRMTEPLSDRGRESVDRVLHQSDRMASLVEDLLLLARLDAAEVGPQGLASVDLGEVVVDAVMDATAAGRDDHLTVEVPEDTVTVRGDRRQLAQLVANLLSNARKHTPAGTTVTVKLDVVRSASADAPEGAGAGALPVSRFARLAVEDNGPGIPADLIPTLFDRFVRGDAARTTTEGSTGLGLSIVRSVARAHGGEATVDTEPGRTAFTVELPTA